MSFDAYDPLYLDKIRLMKLGYGAPPLKPDDLTDLRQLLQLANHIVRPTTSSASKYKRKLAKFQMTAPRQLLMHFRASEIGRQMALHDENSKSEKRTWKILEGSPDIPLKAMAILSLVAFATMYGKVQLVALEPKYNSNQQLEKSVVLLKQQLTANDPIKNWSNTLKTVLSRALDVATQVMDMEEPHSRALPDEVKILNKRLLASSVHKIVNVIIICWSQVVEILIKRSRETLWRKSALLDSNSWTLENKLSEIKLFVQDGTDPQPPPKDSNEAASQGVSCSYWRKLCLLLLNPKIVKSLPDRVDSMSLSGQGALRADEEETG